MKPQDSKRQRLKRAGTVCYARPMAIDRPATTGAAQGVTGATRAAVAPLASLVPADWRRELGPAIKAPSFQQLGTFIDQESQSANVFPPRAQIFAALKRTPLKNVKVVILGQDPYFSKGQANGLAFSLNKGQPLPGSLKNIFAGLNADTGLPVPTTPDLGKWADNGVLMLNTVLTVREGKPNSHRKKGWEPFTEAVLKKVNEQSGPVVFLCFGNQAKDMVERLIDPSKHTLLHVTHPSTQNGTKFVEDVKRERIFTHANQILTAGGRPAVNWALP